MNKDLSFKKFKEEALKNPAVKAEYDALGPEFELIEKRIQRKKQKKFTKRLTEKNLTK